MVTDNTALYTHFITFSQQLISLAAPPAGIPLAYQQALGMTRLLLSLVPVDWGTVPVESVEMYIKSCWQIGAQVSPVERNALYEKALALLSAYPSLAEYAPLEELKGDLHAALGRLRLQLSAQAVAVQSLSSLPSTSVTDVEQRLVLSTLADYLAALALAKTPEKRHARLQELYQLACEFTSRLLKPYALAMHRHCDKALQLAKAGKKDGEETLNQTIAQLARWQRHHQFDAAYALAQLIVERWPRHAPLGRVQQALLAFIDLNQAYLNAQSLAVQVQCANRYRDVFFAYQAQWQAQFPSSFQLIEAFQQQVHTDLTTFYRQLITDAESLLGPAPGRICWLSLGSMARGDVTPCSDLECAVLVDKKTPELLSYVQTVLWFVEFHVQSLGQTLHASEGLHLDAPPRVIDIAKLDTHLIEMPGDLVRYQAMGKTNTLVAYSLLRPAFLAGDIELLNDYYRCLPPPSSTRLQALLQAHTRDLAYEVKVPVNSSDLKHLWLQPLVLLICDMALYYDLPITITHPFAILKALEFPTDPNNNNNNTQAPLHLAKRFVQSASRSLALLYQARIQAQRAPYTATLSTDDLMFIRDPATV